MEFDEKTLSVHWENGSQRIDRRSTFNLLKALYEMNGELLTFQDARFALKASGANAVSCGISRLRKQLRYTFPYEIESNVKEGYRLVKKKRLETKTEYV